MFDMISYDVTIDPSPAEIDVTVAVDNTKLKATISSVPSISFGLTPSGNLIQKILSAVALPIAALIADLVKNEPKKVLEGMNVPIGTIPDYPTNGITIVPSNLTLGSANVGSATMLKVTADLAVTAPSASRRT